MQAFLHVDIHEQNHNYSKLKILLGFSVAAYIRYFDIDRDTG